MIYLIYCNTTKACKIGYSKDPKIRLGQLQTGNSNHLELISIIEGSYNKETELHNKFQHLSLTGEWFSYAREISTYFKVERHLMLSKLLFNAISKDLSLVEMKVYAYLLEHNNAGAEIGITKKMKESICAATNISHINSVSNALKSLQEKELPFLFKSGRGTYILNPRYAYQGSTKNRDKHLKAIIDLGCTNC